MTKAARVSNELLKLFFLVQSNVNEEWHSAGLDDQAESNWARPRDIHLQMTPSLSSPSVVSR